MILSAFVLSTMVMLGNAQATWNPEHTFLITSGDDGTTNVTVDWRVTAYDDVTVRVGSAVEFVYSPYHDVYVHPTGDCSTDGRIFVSDESEERGSYEFTEVGMVTFACDVAEGAHCQAGQIVHFNVLPAEDHDKDGDEEGGDNGHYAKEEDQDDHNHSEAAGHSDADTKIAEQEDQSQEDVRAPAETVAEESGAPMFSEVFFAAALSLFIAMV